MDRTTTIDRRTDVPQAGAFLSGPCAPQLSRSSVTEALVDPGNAFADPGEVLGHPLFRPEEKRMILLSWARDELLLEQMANRTLPELCPGSRIDAVIDVLSHVDPAAAAEYRRAAASIRAAHQRRTHDAKDRGRGSWTVQEGKVPLDHEEFTR